MATSTTNFNLTKPADTDPVDIVILEGDNMDKIDAAMQDNKTPTFNDYNSSESGMPSESQALTNIKSKATLSTLFQNIKAYLKKACTVGQLVTNCTSSSNTLPLAASQGKVLQDQITTLNRNFTFKFHSCQIGASSQYDFSYEGYMMCMLIAVRENEKVVFLFDTWGNASAVHSSDKLSVACSEKNINLNNSWTAAFNCTFICCGKYEN